MFLVIMYLHYNFIATNTSDVVPFHHILKFPCLLACNYARKRKQRT